MVAMPSSGTQISLDPALRGAAKRRAEELGLSFAEYVGRLIARDLSDRESETSILDLAGIGDSGGSVALDTHFAVYRHGARRQHALDVVR